jgi:hypothetical protein
MAGYMGSAKGHIKMNNSGYDRKSLQKSPKTFKPLQKSIIPPHGNSIVIHRNNRVFNYNMSNKSITKDSYLSSLI